MKTQFSFCQPKKLLFLFLAGWMLLACVPEALEGDQSTSDGNTSSIPVSEDLTYGSAVIGPGGGEINLLSTEGNVKFFVPQGALSSSTEITIYTQKQNDLGEIRLGFEPDGLIFNKPARLTVDISQDRFDTHALTAMYNISELNELVDRGSEQHRWERLSNVDIGSNGRSISGDIEHFSTGFVLLGVQRVAYLIVDIPGKYLRPGDALFVLSGNDKKEYNWVPGHVGFVNKVNPFDGTLHGNLQVLESTLDGGINGNINGVQLNPFSRFKVTANHLYMGARRPTKPSVKYTDAERKTTISFARSKLGLGYGYLGGIFPNRWTCSELVEAAWDIANRGVFTYGKEFFPSPVEMFEKTYPVSEISAEVGKEIEIPVYPVVVDKSSDLITSTGYYVGGKQYTNSTLLLTGTAPDGSEWINYSGGKYHGRMFKWTPKPQDAGKTVRINFKMTGSVQLDVGYSKSYSVDQYLDIHVRGDYTTINVTPVQMGSSGTWYDHYFAVPENAVIGPNSTSHLIDTATGEFPVNPIFPNQILDSYEEGWIDPVTKTHYGTTFHLKRLDNPFDPPPAGEHTWGYYIDWYLPQYNGL